MNTRSVLMALTAAALLGAGSAHAADRVSLEESVRLQMQQASASIGASIRTSLREQPLVLDVPGVEVGEIRVVDAIETRPVLLESSSTGALQGQFLHIETILKSLEAQGLHASYRIITVPTVAMGR